MTQHDTLGGVPVRQTDKGTTFTYRGGWAISEKDVLDGDVIEWPPVLGDPRYIEHLTQAHPDVIEQIKGQPLLLVAIEPEEPVQPCTFCSTRMGVAERGIVDSDYSMYTEDGEWVGNTCHGCVADADTTAFDNDV